ncbi:MAG TPA: DUF4282 domain-containing protein [Stellaceae bacterium]|nr:DUF4282 domain-containing protein [Stellaceae bacterium]
MPRSKGMGETMQKYFNFDELITPTIITIIYWIGIVLIVLGALSSVYGGFGAFVVGIIVGAISLVLWRVWCEVMLILFRIHADLGQIARNTAPQPGSAPPRA